MRKNKKIKFKKYTVTYKGHNYEILIPPDAEQLWITGYADKHWGTNWDGNRKGLKALLYSFTVLGFNPTDKVVYIPIRGNETPECYKSKNAFPGESSTEVEDCDLVFITHQAQLKRSDWVNIRRTLKYRKAESYVFCYNQKRCNQYFQKKCDKWEYSNDSRKEYAIEVMQDATLFYVFSRRMFQRLYLEAEEFLQRNLESEFLNREYGIPFDFVRMGHAYFPYRKKKQMTYNVEYGFNDIALEKRKILAWKKQRERDGGKPCNL